MCIRDRTAASPITVDFPEVSDVWMSHGDSITALGEGFVATASSDDAPVAVFGNENLRSYGVQFHPEVAHSEYGQALL